MLMESPSQYQVIRLALFHLFSNTRLSVNVNEIEQFLSETISRIELNYFIQNITVLIQSIVLSDIRYQIYVDPVSSFDLE